MDKQGLAVYDLLYFCICLHFFHNKKNFKSTAETPPSPPGYEVRARGPPEGHHPLSGESCDWRKARPPQAWNLLPAPGRSYSILRIQIQIDLSSFEKWILGPCPPHGAITSTTTHFPLEGNEKAFLDIGRQAPVSSPGSVLNTHTLGLQPRPTEQTEQ